MYVLLKNFYEVEIDGWEQLIVRNKTRDVVTASYLLRRGIVIVAVDLGLRLSIEVVVVGNVSTSLLANGWGS